MVAMKGAERMKKRISILLVLTVFPLLLGASVPGLAWHPRRISGDIGFTVPEWGNPKVWFHFDVLQLSRRTHRAWGQVSWILYNESLEGEQWRYLTTRPTCVIFGEYQERPAATFVVQIVTKTGFGQGEPGEYAVVWVLDGGTPGSEGDFWAKPSYQDQPDWIEFWPEDDPPACEDYPPEDLPEGLIPPQPVAVQGGDLVIHR
jgi:hypothetical protein